MSDQTGPVSLEDIRVRFLDAEAHLSEAATAIGAIQEAAERLGSARDGLAAASAQLANLAGSLEEVTSSLSDNAVSLREGVDAIRAGDPADIKRMIGELDAAFTGMQSVVGERLTKLEQLGSALTASVEADRQDSRRQLWILGAALAVLTIGSIVVGLLP
jgi:ABC-type transporter Mla subunit MlaD